MALIYLQSFFFHSIDLCLPRLTARRNRPNQFCESQSLTSNQTPSRAFRAVDKILDRISSLMCVIFRIAKKSLSMQRE